MTNFEYFKDDCRSCKYLIGTKGCVVLYKGDEQCTYCKNKDEHDTCYCSKRADMTLKRCPYWRNSDG